MLAANRNTSSKFRVPKCLIIKNSAIRNPKSPMRLTMNAFLPAEVAESLVNQKPIRRYEASPPPTDKQQQIIAGEHQREHEEHEQVQITEEAVETAFLPHIADGVNVDQKSDAGHNQQHDQ